MRPGFSTVLAASVFIGGVLTARAINLSEPEALALHRALAALNASEADLGFQKDVAEPLDAFDWIRRALHDPLALNRAGQTLLDTAQLKDPEALWELARTLMELERADSETPPEMDTDVLARIPDQFRPALSRFIREARRAESLIERALQPLSDDEKQRLAATALGGAFRLRDDAEARVSFTRAGIGEAAIEAQIRSIDELDARPAGEAFIRTGLRFGHAVALEAGRIAHRAARELAEAAATISDWPEQTLILDVPAFGRIVLLGTQESSFSETAPLIIAPRGSQRYTGLAGAANGLAGSPLSVLIDLEGNDVYESRDLMGAAGGLFGVAVVVDRAGDDTWRLAHTGLGCGIWGAGILEDQGGHDRYEAATFSQGAALSGVGLLIDNSGNDRYAVGHHGQGFAGWRGFGLLIDGNGQDEYFAGGREPDHERNPHRFLSLAQGFAIGPRPFAGGGVGALVDLAGNDVYLADVFGQGASYYYAAGLLIDVGGHDLYVTHHYGQGCGIHLSLGLLADLEGDDRYLGGILAQGAAHDFAVGFLLDRTGRDTYAADRHAQGHGMNNSVGILIDSAGDDVYVAREAETAQGVGNTGGFRESGSLGLLLDLAGHDQYSSGARDGAIAIRALYGALLDDPAGVDGD